MAMEVMKVILLSIFLHACSCIENFDTEKCKDLHGGKLSENFALFKAASQTSTKDGAVAARATDGNTDPYFGNASCSQTDVGDTLMWQVNLGEEIYVTSVTITTRADQYWSSSDFFLISIGLVGSEGSNCAEGFFPNTGESISVTCYMPKKSDFVRVQLLRPQGILSLCEVEVHGWELNRYESEVNYALRQTARLSSLHISAGGTAFTAINGIDGDRGSLMHTEINPFPSWWSVDLGKVITVNAVTIYSLISSFSHERSRIADFSIRIGFAETSDDENYENCVGHILGFGTPETRTLFCTKPARGRYVTIISHVNDYFHLSEVYVHGEEIECAMPESFGLETHKIQDSQFSASSSYPHASDAYGARNARLNFPGGSGRSAAWLSAADDHEPWIEVDLLWIVTVTAVLTQGRATHGHWVTSYSVSSKVDGMEFQFFLEEGRQKVFTGNSDQNTIVRQNLRPAVVARWFRVHPLSWNGRAAMRMELIGCQNGLYGNSFARALGMNNAMILDAQLTASSNEVGWEPKLARLHFDVNGWAAGTPSGSWFQVDFLMVCVVIEIKTQGSAKELYWIKEYQVSHASDIQSFSPYMEGGVVKTFTGNTDQHSVVAQTLYPVIVAKVLRIHPITWEVKTALRVELIGFYRENSIARPLGMEERFIQDSQVHFSTSYGGQYAQPWLSPEAGYNDRCWVPLHEEVRPWLQIDFLRLTKVTKIKTQGRPAAYLQWVVTYYLAFGHDGDVFLVYRRNGKTKIFNGNWDSFSVNAQTVSPAIVSRFLRIYPLHTDNEFAMRVEFEGHYVGFTESCQTVGALGMGDRRISAHQISASSYEDANSIPDHGRLNGRKTDGTFGVWIAGYENTMQWYQVDFQTTVKLIEIHTQGQSHQWVKEYTISFGFDPHFIYSQSYQQNGETKVFEANYDSDSIVQNTLLPAVIARVVRLDIKSWNGKIAMAVEFFGTFEASHGPALIDSEYIALENRLTASSFLDHRHRAIHGILSDNVNATSWTPEVEQLGEYIQVDLLQLTAISGVGLRTGGDHPNDSYVEVMMQYSDVDGNWKVKKNYRGEILTLSTSDCDIQFETVVVVRYVRLVITGWGRRTGFVFQLYGSTEYHKAGAGVEDGSIKDNQMKSSNHPDDPHPAHEARLNHGGAWCGNTLRPHLYLQIDFLSNFEVHAIATQAKSVGIMATVTQYNLSSSLDDINWRFYEEEGLVKIFEANTSCQCSRKHLVQPFLARSVRFLPTSWRNRPCMRVDLYGVYKGILQVHVRSGPVFNVYGTEVTRDCSIKLNGKEVCESKDGVNVVVADLVTGELTWSNSTADYSLLNEFLANVEDESIVVVATQNPLERPPEETLRLLQSLGGIKLRYSLTSERDNWILVGYKGKQKVDWIAEEVGKKHESAIRVATTVPLNQMPTIPEFHNYYMPVDDTNNSSDSELSIAGRHSRLFYNLTERCGINDTRCLPGLSLAMWMKSDTPRNDKLPSEFTSAQERFVFKYYSNGYNYIIPLYKLNWHDSRRYCLTLGADLPVILDKLTETTINKILTRAGVPKSINIGLRRHPVTSEFEWVDGSPLVYMNWHPNEPDSGECVSRFYTTQWDCLNCFTHLRQVICQQPIEGLTGLLPIGVEANVIPDTKMASSTIHDDAHLAEYGRLNTARNLYRAWCSLLADEEPYLQVDLGYIRATCGVGTQGRGKDDDGYKCWPKLYSVALSNDSSTWTTFTQDKKALKVFLANDDFNTVVINRFHEPAVAQVIRLQFLQWNSGFTCCARMEVFACADDKTQEASQPPQVPGSVTEIEPENCLDVLMAGKTDDGVYFINPGNGAFPVYCDQTTDGGGWTVLQRRMDGTVDFYRSYEEYEAGFGDISGEHWLGLAKMAMLTHSYSSDLRVDLKDWDDVNFQTVYSDFMVDEQRWEYKLRYSQWLGPGADSLQHHRDGTFSTKDQGNFKSTAKFYHTGWWFVEASRWVNLNGKYYNTKVHNVAGNKWWGWRLSHTVKETKMMIRRNGKGGKQGALGLTDWHYYVSDTITAVNAKLDANSFLNMDDAGVVYLEGDFFAMRRLTHISTQGGTNSHFVKQYYLRLSLGLENWIDYKENGVLKLFEGNNELTQGDASHVVSNCLKETELARMVRIYPTTCQGSCSIRLEIYSCFESCSKPVDVQDSNVFPDSRMQASSNEIDGSPWFGRLHYPGKQWSTDSQRANEFLEIRLPQLLKVTSVATQGGGDCWVKRFSILYRDKNVKWKQYTGKNGEIFPGNRNSKSVVRTRFDRSFLAHMVRFVAKTWHNKICMRTEVYGCPVDNPVFVVYTGNASAGRIVTMNGKYRYCAHCECPGCLKSLWMRVFGQDILVAAYFPYDCLYHEFAVNVTASIVPGRHKIYMGASQSGKEITGDTLLDERLVGIITVTKEFYASCLDLLLAGKTKSKVYEIQPDNEFAFKVYCDQERYGGGWTLFQRHVNDDEHFNRTWAEYKNGFGELTSNFWLGNEHIHRLTRNVQELLLDLDSVNGDHTFILYKSFQVESEETFYTLHVSEYQQSVGNCMNYFDGMKFSTADEDHDRKDSKNCAEVRKAGWWFRGCTNCHLNGLFDPNEGDGQRFKMDDWQDNQYLDWSEIKLRNKEVVTCGDQYCYYLLKSTLHWNGALEKCRSFNADLPSIRDATENEWIVDNILKSQAISHVHLGANNMTHWTDGSKFSYNNFPASQPDGGCSYLRIDGVWGVGDCGNLTHVLCKRAKFCYNDACHVFTPEKMNYNAAEEYCRDIGYNVIKINSEEKNEYIADIIKSSTMDDGYFNAFLGLVRSDVKFFWYDGTRLGVENWQNNQPETSGIGNECVKLTVTGWASVQCSEIQAVLCEKVHSSKKKPIDCLELLLSGSLRSGVYTIYPDAHIPITVYCDQENFGGGWTVLMRRRFDSTKFHRLWKKYKVGFGSPDDSFWLGNDHIHVLTRITKEALFELKSNAGAKASVHYKTFQVAHESDSYRLTIDDYQTSKAGNAMAEHNDMLFSTYDQDNDLDSADACATFPVAGGGWWFNSCGTATLTARYETASARTAEWKTWTGHEGIDEAEMKIRSQSVVSCTDRFCYYLTGKLSSWSDAVKECRRFNADLVSIHSEADQEWIITNILTPQSLDEIYIGLGMASVETWTDESRLSFTNITNTVPSNKCVVLKRDGLWAIVDCAEAKHVLCKRAKFCFNGDCYVVNLTPKNHIASMDYCENIGYNLAKITNKQEDKYIMDTIRQCSHDAGKHDCYIGLYRVNGQHEWLADSTKLQYHNWGGDDPDMELADQLATRVWKDDTWYDIPPTALRCQLCEKGPVVTSCSEVRRHGGRESGFYTVSAHGTKLFRVYCDLASDDSPWTVIQRRLYNSEPTNYHSKSWDEYKNGFKSDEMNFWLGNSYIHELTKTAHRLKIVITTEEFNTYEAVYEDFTMKNETFRFQVNFGSYSGTAGDSFSKHRGMRFSTVDDDVSGTSCTSTHPGGWWFAECLDSNLNGIFDEASNAQDNIYWKTINERIIKTEMKIQPYHDKVSTTQYSGVVNAANVSLGMSFISDTTEIKVRTATEEWTTRVANPGPFLTHVAVTWDANGNLRYYENGSLRADNTSVVLSGEDNQDLSMSVANREYLWLNELTLWNSALSEFSAKNEHNTRNFTFDNEVCLWIFENSSQPYSWRSNGTCTPSDSTGPCGDHTYSTSLGTFVFVEASRPAEWNDRAVTTSPNLPDSYRCLRFWVHMFGTKFGSLSVHFSTTTSINRSLEIPVLDNDYGNEWKYMEIDVDVTHVFKIVIEAKRGDGSLADIAVDDLMLTTTSCKKECDPPCKLEEKCDPSTLVCVYEGLYDHRWRLDSLSIVDEKDLTLGVITGQVEVESEGVLGNCTALRDDGKIEFRTISRSCFYHWCYPFYTLSFWLKYEERNFQNIFSFGELVKIYQTPEEHLSVEVKSTTQSCSTSFFVPTEVWSHIIVSVETWKDVILVYSDGEVVANTSRFLCIKFNEVQNIPTILITAGGNGDVSFALDDVRVLFDALQISKTLESYKNRTGFGQNIFLQADMTAESWSDDLMDDESENYKLLTAIIKTKIMETFQNRSNIIDVIVERFTQGSVIADINIVYNEVTYQDILLVEEAIYVNNTFNGLNIQSYEFNSTSVPNVAPTISAYMSPNTTSVYLNWTEVTSLDLNGIFQGYKVLHRVTEQSANTEYAARVLYGNKTELLLTDLEMYTNYTLRVLAFTLSGDGFISDSVTVMTLDGVPEGPNISATAISSTSLYVNWTMLPNSTNFYKQLQGYHIFYWKESEDDKISNLTQFKNEILLDNLEKWTTYCFNITAFTYGSVGPSRELCTRTLEDAPEDPPETVTVENVDVNEIELSWSPPNVSAVPGILRYYNFTYRILNDSSSEMTSHSLANTTLTYTVTNLRGLSLVQINISAFTVASGPVYTLMVLTEEGVPLIAPNLTIVNVSSTSYKLNWTAIPKIFHNGIFLGFHLQIWKESEGIETARNLTYKPAVRIIQVSNAAKWTIFCARISGYTAVGDGPRSAVECTRTFEDAPERPPSDFEAVEVTNFTIDLQWSPPPSNFVPGIIRQYNLTYRNLNYTEELLVEEDFDSSVTSYKMENLIGLTLYEINITASTVLPGPWETLYVLTLEGVPEIAPPNSSWFNTSSTSVRQEWSMIPKPLRNGVVLGYRVFIWKEADGPSSKWSVTIPATNLTSDIGELEKYTRYCGQMEAFTRVGPGPRSSVECTRTFEDAVEIAPAWSNASNITWNECHLSWEPVNSSFIPGILRAYRVTYRIVDPRFDQSNTTFLVDSQFNSTVVTGLLGFVDYQVMVNGYTIKDGPVSISYFKTEEGVPTSPPSGFLGTDVTVTTITIAWQEIPLPERHGIITGYELTYRKTTARSKRDVEKTLTFDANTHTAFLYKLVAYTNYTITLRGRTSVGYGALGEIVIRTLQGTPSIAPKEFRGVNFTGPTSIFLSWGGLSEEELQGTLSGYEVRYQVFSVSDEELLHPPPEKVSVVHGNNVKFTGLSTYTTYKVSIAAISAGGKGVTSRIIYVATCRCHKTLTTNFWQYQPYVNISGYNKDRGFFPYLLDKVTLFCCQTCLEHGTTDIDYFHDGEGRPSEKSSDIDVKRKLTLNTDYSFPIYGFFGQTVYSKYYGYASIVDVVGTVFFTLKPDSSVQTQALLTSVLSILPFLAIAVVFAYLAGVIIWALERKSNQEEFSPSFIRGAASGFWWAYITMTTVGYGDKTARTLLGRVFALVWVLIGLVIGSLLIGSIASAFTSTTSAPVDSVKMLYGANVAALHDSPDHKLGVRRNAEVNKLKKYESLESLREAVLRKEVDGMLVDSYVADSRSNLFSDLSIKQVIDLRSSYGVVMGTDASKIRKCINKYWKDNAAMKTDFINKNAKPVVPSEVTAADMFGDSLSHESDVYSLTLTICSILLCVGSLCGCIYEIMRRKKRAKVQPEDIGDIETDVEEEPSGFSIEKLHNNIEELKSKHKKQIIAFVKSKQKNKEQGDESIEEGEYVPADTNHS